MDNIKIIRLQNGEDVIGTYSEQEGDGTVLISNPMTLFFKRLPSGKAVMLMSPWLPVELIEINATYLYTNDILSVLQPKASLIEYYTKSVQEMMLEMYERNDELETALNSEPMSIDELVEDDSQDYSFDGVSEEELRDEMEALRTDIKKKLYH